MKPARKPPAPKPEVWVPCETKHMWRDINSHPDPAYQRRKYTPPDPSLNWVRGYTAVP